MSALGFGFSVGDFIAGIQLVIQAYEALQDVGGAASDIQQQAAYLKAAIPVLAKVENIPLGGFEDVINACNGPLSALKSKMAKYERHLESQNLAASGTNAKAILALKTAPAKLRWAFSGKKDVKELRIAIADYISVINSKLGLQVLDTTEQLQQNVEQIGIKQNHLHDEVGEVGRQLHAFQPFVQNALDVAVKGMQSDVNVATSASTTQFNAVLTETGRINQGFGLLNEDYKTNSAAILRRLELQGEHLELARVEQMNLWKKTMTKINRLQIPNPPSPSAGVLVHREQARNQLAIFNRQNLLPNRSITARGHLEVMSTEALQMILEFKQYIAYGIRQFLKALWLIYPTLRRLFIAMGSFTLQPSAILGDSIRFEDVLGRVRYLPYEQFKYWDVFSTMLRCDFKGLPGEREIIQGMYRITSFRSKPLIVDRNSWNDKVLPGSKISMAVVLDEYKVPANRCPRCGTMLESFYSVSDGDALSQYDKCDNCSFILSRNLIKRYRLRELKFSNPETPSLAGSADPESSTPSSTLAIEGQRASTTSEPVEMNEAVKAFRQIHIIAKSVYVLNALKEVLIARPSITRDLGGIVYVFRNPAYTNALHLGSTSSIVTRILGSVEARCKFQPVLVFQQQSRYIRTLERLCWSTLVLERRLQKSCPGCHLAHREYFEVDIPLIRTVISRWSRWLETNPFDEDGTLNAYWMSRIFEPDYPKTLEDLYDVVDRG